MIVLYKHQKVKTWVRTSDTPPGTYKPGDKEGKPIDRHKDSNT